MDSGAGDWPCHGPKALRDWAADYDSFHWRLACVLSGGHPGRPCAVAGPTASGHLLVGCHRLCTRVVCAGVLVTRLLACYRRHGRCRLASGCDRYAGSPNARPARSGAWAFMPLAARLRRFSLPCWWECCSHCLTGGRCCRYRQSPRPQWALPFCFFISAFPTATPAHHSPKPIFLRSPASGEAVQGCF